MGPGTRRYHLVLDRPRNVPGRTALGVAILAMAVDIQLAGADDAIAYHLHMPVEYLVWFLRIGFFGLPLISFAVTWHVCLALHAPTAASCSRAPSTASPRPGARMCR